MLESVHSMSTLGKTYQRLHRAFSSEARCCSRNFLGKRQAKYIFRCSGFNPYAQSLRNTSLTQCYKQNKLQKRRAYDQQIREIERGSFSPLVSSTTGGMGPTATIVYKRLASMIANKHNKTYSKTIHWLRCRLSFSLL